MIYDCVREREREERERGGFFLVLKKRISFSGTRTYIPSLVGSRLIFFLTKNLYS